MTKCRIHLPLIPTFSRATSLCSMQISNKHPIGHFGNACAFCMATGNDNPAVHETRKARDEWDSSDEVGSSADESVTTTWKVNTHL